MYLLTENAPELNTKLSVVKIKKETKKERKKKEKSRKNLKCP